MSNIIRRRKKENPFIMLDKTCINDNRLSWKAKGLHTYIMGLPEDWKIYVHELINHSTDGITSTRAGINELLKHGYMKRIRTYTDGRITSWDYEIYETPCDDDSYEEVLHVENHRESIETTNVDLECENLTLGNLSVENNVLLNNNNTKYINILNNEEVVVVVSEEKDKEEKVLNLYKSMKAEKRVMPHTIKLIKSYIGKFDYEVFEEVFISGTGSNVDNFYKYIKQVFLELDKKNIKTIKDYELDNENFRTKKRQSRKLESHKIDNTSIPHNRNKFHNFSGSKNFKKYSPEELERILLESQKDKFNKN